METKKLLREKRFVVKPFKRVEMYDPWYVEDGKLSENAKNLCAFYDVPVTGRKAEVLLREIHGTFDYDGKEISYTTYEVRFFSYRKDVPLAIKEIAAECEDMCYPALVKENRDLGCDTAKFNICVDGNELHIETGADGYYGRVSKYKNNYAYYFDFVLNDDITDWDELESSIKYLFQVN